MRYRTIKEPAVSGRVTVKEVERAARALQRQAINPSKPKKSQDAHLNVARKRSTKKAR